MFAFVPAAESRAPVSCSQGALQALGARQLPPLVRHRSGRLEEPSVKWGVLAHVATLSTSGDSLCSMLTLPSFGLLPTSGMAQGPVAHLHNNRGMQASTCPRPGVCRACKESTICTLHGVLRTFCGEDIVWTRHGVKRTCCLLWRGQVVHVTLCGNNMQWRGHVEESTSCGGESECTVGHDEERTCSGEGSVSKGHDMDMASCRQDILWPDRVDAGT